MSVLDYAALLGGGGLAIGAAVYALYTNHSLSGIIASQASLVIGLGSKLSDSERNALSYQQQRDTEKGRGDQLDAELKLAKSQLVSTQAALVAAQKVNTENAAKSVAVAGGAAPDVLASVLQASARGEVPDSGSAPAADSSRR